MPLESIRSLVHEDLESTDRFIISQLNSNIPLIKQVIEYVLTCGGKRVRPLILLLCARALNNKQDKHIDIAAVIELFHMATLLHDDVVDGSTLRRGHQTANLVWNSATSVLIGDFLYSRTFRIIVELNNPRLLDIFSHATHYISEGEILQIVNCHNPETTPEFYYDIIMRKTAKLFEISTQLGALLATSNEEHIEAMRVYGMSLGLAYQLIDDALDYSGSPDKTGKNIGQDIANGKTTLPLIHALGHSKPASKLLLQKAIIKGETERMDDILEIIDATNAIQYTADAARRHADEAKAALSILPKSPYKEALEKMSDFVVSRSY
jgi:octaprenyl-diphosphate synthase